MSSTAWITALTALVPGVSCGIPAPDTAMHPTARILHDEVASGRTPGVQYRHFTADSVLFTHDEGWADIGRGARVTPATTFHGLSVTKTATAVAILQLAERGLLELDGPAAAYLPDFPYGDGITVRQLLAHSAGIPNPLPLRWIHLAAEHAAFDAPAFFAPVFAAYPTPKSAPNARFRYSNLGYVLLGDIVAQVSGASYERYVTDSILAPLGLTPSELGFALDPAVHATGYHRRRAPSRLLLGLLIDAPRYLEPGVGRWQAFRPYHVNGSAYGGLIGTADGFRRYAQALLDESSGLLTPPSRRALFTENVLRSGAATGMSLSWYAGALDGTRYHAHAGGGGGYYAELRLYPALGRGSVLLFNRSGMSDARFLDAVDRHLVAVPRPPSGASRSARRDGGSREDGPRDNARASQSRALASRPFGTGSRRRATSR